MFRANKRPVQPALLSHVNELPEKRRQRLEASWAGTFRREVYERIDEQPFAVLYAEVPSRPNAAVNRMLSLETLKSGFGWSDEELHDHFLYDMQVRYALGLDSLNEGEFELRTVYNFRRRLSEYDVTHGTNLVALAFADITDQQLTELALRTGQQRMDSTQVASSIMLMSRLQLAVEAIQRLERLLTAADKERYCVLLAPYVGERASHYVYRIKDQAAKDAQLQAAGAVLYQLLEGMAEGYGQAVPYQVAARLFGEQFRVVEAAVQAKANKELTSGSLQSLDDVEATYREKNNVGYRGYVANVSETCDPANQVQLITDVRVASNNTQDSDLLIAALPDLKQRTGLDTLYTDGAFASPDADVVLQQQQVTQVQTGILGKAPNPDKLHLADFAISQDEAGNPLTVTCPEGQTVAVVPGRQPGRFRAQFDPQRCQDCPLHQAQRCPPQRRADRRPQGLSFGLADVARSQRRRRSRALHESGHNPRAAVEAAVRSLKHPFPASKLPVRGLFRVTCVLLGSALMTNVRRIHRYLTATRPKPAAGAVEALNQAPQTAAAAETQPANALTGTGQHPVRPQRTSLLVAFGAAWRLIRASLHNAPGRTRCLLQPSSALTAVPGLLT